MRKFRVRPYRQRIVAVIHVHENGGAMAALVVEQAPAGFALADVRPVRAQQAALGLVKQVGGLIGEEVVRVSDFRGPEEVRCGVDTSISGVAD